MAPVLRSNPPRTDRYQPLDFRSTAATNASNGGNSQPSSSTRRQRRSGSPRMQLATRTQDHAHGSTFGTISDDPHRDSSGERSLSSPNQIRRTAANLVRLSPLSPGQVPSAERTSASGSSTASGTLNPVPFSAMRGKKRSRSEIAGDESDESSGSVQFLESRQVNQQPVEQFQYESDIANGTANIEPIPGPSGVRTRSQTRTSISRTASIPYATVRSIVQPQSSNLVHLNWGAIPRQSARRGRSGRGIMARERSDDYGGQPQTAIRGRPRQGARGMSRPSLIPEEVTEESESDNEQLPLFGSESTCTICLNQVEDLAVLLPCFHEFDRKCIKTWFKGSRHCPVCRATISKFRSKFR